MTIPPAGLAALAALAAPIALVAALHAGTRAWARPVLLAAVGVALIAVPLKSGEEGAELAHLRLPDAASALLVLLVAAKVLFGGPDAGVRAAARMRSWVALPLVLVVLAGALSAAFADDVASGIAGWVRVCQVFVVVPLCVFLALEERRDLRLILWVVVGLGAYEGALGVYQYLTGTGAQYGGGTRAVGSFGAYEIMGMATVVTYAIVAAWAVAFGARERRSRLAGFAFAISFVAPLLFSLSRGAWIAAALGLAVVALFAASPKEVLALALAVTLSVGGYVAIDAGGTASKTLIERASSITSSLGDGADQSVSDRYALWQASRSMLEERPLVGVGPKNFALHRDEHVPLSFTGGSDIADASGGFRRVELLTPHSLYWLILAEQGLVGGFAYAILFGSLGVAACSRAWKARAAATCRTEGSLAGVEGIFALSCLGWFAAFLMRSVSGDLGGSAMLLDSVMFGGLLWLAAGCRAAPDGGRGRGGRRGYAAGPTKGHAGWGVAGRSDRTKEGAPA